MASGIPPLEAYVQLHLCGQSPMPVFIRRQQEALAGAEPTAAFLLNAFSTKLKSYFILN